MFENNAKCFFIYSLIFILSLMTGIGIDGVLDHIITYTHDLPEFAWKYNTLRAHISFIAIGFPFLCVFIYLAQSNLRLNNFTTDNIFRKWILYVALSFASLFILYGLARIFHSWLDGKLIWSVVLNFGVLILIAVLAFSYFVIDVSKKDDPLTLTQKLLIVVISGISIITFCYGLKYNKTKEEAEKIEKQAHLKKKKEDPSQDSSKALKSPKKKVKG